MKNIKKLLTWIGISSIGLITIGLPLLFIGGSGQEVSQATINTTTYILGGKSMLINPVNQPDGFFESPGVPKDSVINEANQDIKNRLAVINDEYVIVKQNVSNSGFFNTRSLNDQVIFAINKIGEQVRLIRDNIKLPISTPETTNTNYTLSSSSFDIEQQLRLIVRVDPINNSIISVLEKNIVDNTNLAISGIIFSIIGGIGFASLVGYAIFKKVYNNQY